MVIAEAISLRAGALVALFALAGALCAQSVGTIKGSVMDETGAIIPGTTVTATGGGTTKTATADALGNYAVAGLPPGPYVIRATYTGLELATAPTVTLSAGQVAVVNLSLRVVASKQEVTVQDNAGPAVSVEPTNNAGALVLRGVDLEALPDDPDDLQADLEALAGPSAGPSGPQMFIDGFTGGRLPPKESIREIRINQNPFSSEYDHVGFGRIEIFTKPGTDKFRGQGFFNISDTEFNSRNPFGPAEKAPFQSKQFGGNVSGPLGRKASFFFDLERRQIDDDAIIHAITLDPATFIQTPLSEFLATPQRRTTVSPRVDYQLNSNNTLMARYTFTKNDQQNAGLGGGLSLPTAGYNTNTDESSVQVTETAVLGTKINETRFQYLHYNISDLAQNTLPAVNVPGSFTGGGAQVGKTYDYQNHYELQNYTSMVKGTHSWKFGVRVRTIAQDSISPQNFGGSYTFAGGPAPALDANNQPIPGQTIQISSIENYRRALLFSSIGPGMGLTADEIRTLGGAPSQVTISGGTPEVTANQTDIGLFFNDDWRAKRNLTVSYGLRYETQTNIHDWRDWAPRLGFAWAPGGGGKNARPKMVLRGGFGIFYDRFSETSYLDSLRFNGVLQQQYIYNCAAIPAPTACNVMASPLSGGGLGFVSTPPITAGSGLQNTTHVVDPTLRAPYVLQSAIGIERQLPHNTTLNINYTNSHGLHELLTRNINAFLPETTIQPYGPVGNIYQYESAGLYNQNQFIVNVNSRLSSRISIFGGYVLNRARSNTDGTGSFPANQYNLAQDYGRSSLDRHNRLFLSGSMTTLWKVRVSPFIIANSGQPFNITTGRIDPADGLSTDRPSLATDLTAPGVVITRLGGFNVQPAPGQALIPRNFGDGPGYFSVNIRMSRTFGFGPVKERSGVNPALAGMGGGDRGPRGGGFGGGGDHGPRGGGGGGGPRGGGGGGPRGGGGGGDALTNRRFNLTASLQARNLFNHDNLGNYVGSLTSPLFGQATQLGGFGGGGGSANNRRIELSLRLSF